MLSAVKTNPRMIWTPQAGSQALFMACPYFECLYGGTRGPGKTDALIMDFAQHVGVGYGQHWRGVLFRRTYPQLSDVIAKTNQWFHEIFPDAVYNKGQHVWTFRDGEQLLLRHFDKPDSYWNYHGHGYPWIGWEELTNWPTLEGYEAMMSCCRSAHPGMPRKYRATANPYGVGHNAVKARFVDPAAPGVPVTDSQGRVRVYIHGTIFENKILLENDPAYLPNLLALSDETKKQAWLYGNWDIVAGGALDDVWNPSVHVLDPFEIPKTWYVDRSFDWGSSHPFSVCWWAESDGSEAVMADGTKRTFPAGTLFHIDEWYGWNGKPNEGCRMITAEIAKGIKERDQKMGRPVLAGAADTSIYDVGPDGHSIAEEMGKWGITWTRADKRSGSRRTGLELMRSRFEAGLKHPMEEPGLFVFSNCRHFIRTVPILPRSERDPEDIDSEAEDHIYDASRYRLSTKRHEVSTAEGWW